MTCMIGIETPWDPSNKIYILRACHRSCRAHISLCDLGGDIHRGKKQRFCAVSISIFDIEKGKNTVYGLTP